jgi:hypothetical protein
MQTRRDVLPFRVSEISRRTVRADVLRNRKRMTGKKYVDRGSVECAWLWK